MSRRVLIKPSSLPPRLPLSHAAIGWLLLDRFDAPGWAFGVLWTLIALLVVGFVVGLCTATLRDVPGFGKD